MAIKPGDILISSPELQDANFEKAVIVIAEYNNKGATGFVVNKLFPRKLNELIEFKNAKAFSLYAGGPVDTENLFMLHKRVDLIDNAQHLFSNVFMGGDFKKAMDGINSEGIQPSEIKLCIGYCGWDAGELEAEIEEGSWILIDTSKEIVFDEGEMLWEKLIKLY